MAEFFDHNCRQVNRSQSLEYNLEPELTKRLELAIQRRKIRL
jgi:hypothetical protein